MKNSTSSNKTVATINNAQSNAKHIDNSIRMLHLLLAVCFVGTYFTGDEVELHQIHTMFGYSFLFVLGLRLVWHFVAKIQQVSAPFSLVKRLKLSQNLIHLNVQNFKASNIKLDKKSSLQKLALLGLHGSIALLLVLIPLTVALGLSTEFTHSHDLKEIHEFLANSVLAAIILHIVSILLNSLIIGKMNFKTMFVPQKNALKSTGSYIVLISVVLITFWMVYLN